MRLDISADKAILVYSQPRYQVHVGTYLADSILILQVSNNKKAPKKIKMYRQLQICEPLPKLKNLYENSERIENKDFESFKNIVLDALEEISFYYERTEFNNLNKVCLDIASKHGLTIFVKSLLREGVNPNRVNKLFKSAPIHFATEGGHVDTLEALLAEPTVNPNLQAGQKTALHIAVNRDDRMCASVLLQKGANANILSEGRPALYLAAEKKKRDMVLLILQKHEQNLDLDDYRERNQTTRDMIKQNFSEMLFFLNKPYALEVLLVTATENDLRTAVKEILNWFHVVDNPRKGIFRDKPNDVFIKHAQLIKHAQIMERAAHVAIDKNRYAILRELLKIIPKIVNKYFIIKVCRQLEQLKRCHISDWVKCMEFMLDKKKVKLHELMDDESNTPLHYAAKSGYKEAIDLFLNRGCYIGHMNMFNTPPIAYISMDTLSSYFDRCMQMKSDEQTKESKIEFNYCCLKPYNDSQIQDSDIRKFPELEVFKYIADNSNLKHLLKHPLLSSFLYLKWRSIGYFLSLNFLINISFYFLLNSYIYRMAINDSFPRRINFVNDNGNFSVGYFRNLPFDPKLHKNTVKLGDDSRGIYAIIEDPEYTWLVYYIPIFLIFYILREFLQLV
ncbi:PREDICTED: transient receptor potential cation channel protein painless-like isoform X2 [Wasmannia auropunctata]|uniref:transient receptor potential cation channel protein painless-like isoform X2 n=1 Tax=Wasmannia auropunctata TaxID=64793 RepID=UPI0005ED5232|nr:PREDICTED: transient receptor potential cation channel protein painless-like isoform X2 [Wasmannia auropunctata]